MIASRQPSLTTPSLAFSSTHLCSLDRHMWEGVLLSLFTVYNTHNCLLISLLEGEIDNSKEGRGLNHIYAPGTGRGPDTESPSPLVKALRRMGWDGTRWNRIVMSGSFQIVTETLA